MSEKKIGPTFSEELSAAGLLGLPFSWGDDGSLSYGEALTEAQIKKIQDVYAAHDPKKELITA